MITEYFSFYNEYDMLELKLQEHAPHVDRFVITESNKTYNQIDKPYRLPQQWDRYKQWHNKITYVKFDATGLESGWPTEEAQREHGVRTVTPAPEDIVLITDLDEFLMTKDFATMHEFIDRKREVLFEMTCYWCFADVMHDRGQKAIAACRYKNYINTTTHRRPQKVFQHLDDPLQDTFIIKGGIHLTWMGDEQRFKEKLLGSIEGYDWTHGKNADDMWREKQDNRLFHWKPKFKSKNTKIIDVSTNNSFSESMREYILSHPEWLFNK